tara:strand:- start:580 stop:765 length:186 start_codon:yes stop_codon:yes gene_type:complete
MKNKTKEINIYELLTFEEKYFLTKLISEKVFSKYKNLYNFKWQLTGIGHLKQKTRSNHLKT